MFFAFFFCSEAVILELKFALKGSTIFWGFHEVPDMFGDVFYYNWAIYNDLSRGHPKWWFSKGIPPQMALK